MKKLVRKVETIRSRCSDSRMLVLERIIYAYIKTSTINYSMEPIIMHWFWQIRDIYRTTTTMLDVRVVLLIKYPPLKIIN